MPITRRPITVLATAAALAAAAPAAQAAPTLRADRACYSTGDVIGLQGEGFTPLGAVDLSITGTSTSGHALEADAGGLLRAPIEMDFDMAEGLIPRDRLQTRVTITASDQAAVAAGLGVAAVASTTTTFSHFGVATFQDPQALRSRRPLRLLAVGFTGMSGRRAYLHYVRAGRRCATVPLGIFRGACGDMTKTLRRAMPARIARPGAWRFVVSTSRLDHRAGLRYEIPVRVVR